MRVSFNPAISYIQPRHQKRSCQTGVSFQAVKPKKIQSPEIFNIEKEWGCYIPSLDKIREVLKKYSHIDINIRDNNGDTIFSRAIREYRHFFNGLVTLESRGEIDGIDWNMKNKDGDNLLMILAKDGAFSHPCNSALVDLANRGKIDANYINRQGGYSLPECFIKHSFASIHVLLRIKDIDLAKTFNNEPILELAIKKKVPEFDFVSMVGHPSIDFSKYDLYDLQRYIKESNLSAREMRKYSEAIETAVKVHNSKKMVKYYSDNGVLTLNQIRDHVDNVSDERAINMPLNELGETIAHFLAETPVNESDEQNVKNLVEKMRKSCCYFWKEDALGRSPLMLALETGNTAVAKAMLEKMHASELSYGGDSMCMYTYSIRGKKINHIPVLWNLISDLDSKDRKELGTLLIERINHTW